MVDIQVAIEKYGACRHGILPLESTDSLIWEYRILRCRICKRERTYKAFQKIVESGRMSAYSHTRRARELGTLGEHTPEQWIERFEYWNKCCVICGLLLTLEPKKSNTASKDHMRPLSWRDSSNSAWNLAPLCRSCNTRKRDRYALKEFPEGSKQLVKVLC
jgi:5-methylcytosine-specific restriction endonuclease McrA